MENSTENTMNLEGAFITSNTKEYKMPTAETKVESHPLATIFPMLGDKELIMLSDDIKTNGQQQPIMIYEGKILDGRNRYAACLRMEVVPRFEEFKGTKKQALDYVLSLNLHRRQLKESQRAMAAASLVWESGGIRGFTQQQAADLFKVSLRSVTSATTILSSANNTLIEKVQNRELPVSLAASVATLNPDVQDELLKMNKKEMRIAVLGHQAFSQGVSYDGVNADQRYAAKNVLQNMTQKDDLNKLKKSLSVMGNAEKNANTITVQFTENEMKMVTASMQKSCDKDSVLFIHDLVMAHCKKRDLAEKKQVKMAAAELAGCGGTKTTDKIAAETTEDDELRALLR